MDFNGREGICQEEERESLMMNAGSYHGGGYGGIAPVKVVEYMLSSMSNELLCKFPDNSAFDFDYTQSSIWSPLVPHPLNRSSSSPDLDLDLDLQRKLSYEDDEHGCDGMVWHSSSGGDTTAATVMKKLTENVKEKIAESCVLSCFRINRKIGKKKMMMKSRRRSFRGFDNLSPIPSSSSGVAADPASTTPIQSKGWGKVLKAASKQFKKTAKKKDSTARLKLSDSLINYF